MTLTPTPKSQLIVGIGASAGGLEALEQFFETIPLETGASFIVVQHLSPDYESRMEEILARRTDIQVRTARNGQLIEPNTVYLLPPKKELTVSEDLLILRDKSPSRSLPLPINCFFTSLAAAYGAKAVGIVLSGTGSDGARGLVDVHQAGGMTLSQDPPTAKFDGMPVCAINTGEVDVILSPDEMWGSIARYRDGESRETLREEQNRNFGEDRSLQQILELLRFEHEIDFKLYKSATVRRRIHRRVEMLELDLDKYIDLLSSDRDEIVALYNDLLIGVTHFFRDPAAFDYLATEIIPKIIEQHRESGEEIRVWVAGCATGQEPYTLAMVFEECFEGKRLPIKIFATDVHRTSLEIAGRGVYSAEDVEKLSDERKKRFFEVTREGYRVNERVRKMVVFARHDIVKSAPFTRMDLVTCRNLLIYLRPPAQLRALSLMHFGLKKDGVLFIGPSETLGDIDDEFLVLNRKWRVYQKIRDIRLATSGRDASSGKLPSLSSPTAAVPPVERSQNGNDLSLRELVVVYDRILEDYMPPSVLVNPEGAIIHSFRGIEKYLTMRVGRPTNNVIDQIHDDLRSTARSALQRAVRTKESVEFPGLSTVINGVKQLVSLRVSPFSPTSTTPNPRYFLVCIESAQSVSEENSNTEITADLNSFDNGNSDDTRNQHIEVLENELSLTRENLHATVEELEISNEEQQAANEELVAANEELQSTNEELHSVNEEIHTVNAELRRKITELSEMSADIEALFESTDVGVIFLDEELRIRRFTPRVADIFNLVPSDEGRFLKHFAHNLDDQDFLKDAEKVIKAEETVEREIYDYDGNPFLLRILPYRIYNELKGVVLTLVDLSSVRNAEQRISKLARIVDHARPAIISVDSNNVVDSWNLAAENLFGYTREEATGKDIRELVAPEGLEAEFAVPWDKVGDFPITLLKTARSHNNGNEIDVSLTLSPILDTNDNVIGRSAFITDITDQVATQSRFLFKREVSEILSQNPGSEEAISSILEETVSQFLRVEAAEFWQPTPLGSDQFTLTAVSAEKHEFLSGRLGKSPVKLTAAGTAFEDMVTEFKPCQLEISESVSELLSISLPAKNIIKSVVAFPVLHMNRCEGFFVLYSKQEEESPPIFEIATTVGRVIGQYLYALRVSAVALSAATREFVLAQFDENGRYTSLVNNHPDFSPENVLGKRDDEIIPGPSGTFLFEKKLACLKKGEPDTFLCELETSTGKITWQMTLFPHLNGNSINGGGGSLVAVDVRSLDSVKN